LPAATQDDHSGWQPGNQQDLYFWPFKLDLGCEFNSSYPRHLDIREEKVYFAFVVFGFLQCLKAVFGHDDFIAVFVQDRDKEPSNGFFIFGQ